MSLKMNDAPYQRSPRTTFRIMMELTAALLIVWLAAVIYNFTLDAEFGVKAILLMVVSLVTTAIIDAGVALIKHKKGGNLKKEIIDSVVRNYSYVTAIIFTLCCPVYVSYYVIIIGCLAATGIKHCFGGFGKNIFNPAIIGRIFTGVAFAGQFLIPEEYVDVMSSSTVTSQYSGLSVKWLSEVLPEGFNMGNLLIGNYVGAMGETFTLLILVLGVILAIRNVINWRSSAFYLGTVAITSLFIGIFIPGLNPFTYMMYHLCLGGLMFGAIFMITDPVTSPTSPFGKALIGVIAGLLTVLIRLDGTNPEGVMYSIAIINLISPMIDRLVTGRTTDGHAKKWGTVAGVLVASIAINTAISVNAYNVANPGQSSTSSSSVAEPTREEKLFAIEGATYEEITTALASDSNIVKVYMAKVEGVDTALCYESTKSHTWDTGHGDATINPTLAITFGLADDKVMTANIENGGSNANFSSNAANFAPNLVGLDASVLAEMTADSHTGCDFVAGATISSTNILELAVESANQYLNVDKLSYNFGYAAAYEKTTLAALPAETNIINTYVGKVNGAANVIGYELKLSHSWDTGHGDAVIDGSVLVAINLADNTIVGASLINGGSNPNFSTNAAKFGANLIGKDAAAIAAMTTDSHDGVDFVTGVTVSSTAAFGVVIEACKQYANDKPVALLGYQAAYEVATLATLPAETNIVNTYVGKVEGVAKVIGYELKVEFSFDTGHGDAVINGSLYITINLDDDKIVTSTLFNGGSADAFSKKASEFASKLINLDANAVAAMTTTSHDGVDYVSGATYSSEKVLSLAIETCSQYANDKVVLNGGAA